jgi:hypothetical protein
MMNEIALANGMHSITPWFGNDNFAPQCHRRISDRSSRAVKSPFNSAHAEHGMLQLEKTTSLEKNRK